MRDFLEGRKEESQQQPHLFSYPDQPQHHGRVVPEIPLEQAQETHNFPDPELLALGLPGLG